MNIVAIGAHQDDIEVSCLGTLILYRELHDASITHVTISTGELGGQAHPDLPLSEIAAIRSSEAQAVAGALGARYVCLDQPDMYVRDTDLARDRLTEVLREARADLVLAPPPVDYHLDHVAVSQLAFHATLAASHRSLARGRQPLPRTPALYYVDTVAGLGWEPSVYVDITPVFARKCELLALHSSQMEATREVGGWDLVRYVEIENGFRGLQSGVAYAEAFTPARAWPRLHAGPTDALVMPR
jgi:N-acetylglucosamine malate deacetylase 1